MKTMLFFVFRIISFQLWPRFTNLVGPIYVITVGEHGSKVTLALSSNIVMIIMILCSSIEGDKLCGT